MHKRASCRRPQSEMHEGSKVAADARNLGKFMAARQTGRDRAEFALSFAALPHHRQVVTID